MMFNIRCCYCNKKLKGFKSYCDNNYCENRDKIRLKPLDDWDLAHPNYNYIEAKERQKILDKCRSKK